MTTAATAAKFNRPRMQDAAAAVLQKRAGSQEAIGDFDKRGKSIIDYISACNQGPAAGAPATVGVNMALPQSRSGGIIPDDHLESLVANLVARTDNNHLGRGRNSKLKLQLVQEADLGGSQGAGRKPLASQMKLTVSHSGVDDDYLWETDPNGAWLSSFP